MIDVLDWCVCEGIVVILYGGGSLVVGGVELCFDELVVMVDVIVMSVVFEIDCVSCVVCI